MNKKFKFALFVISFCTTAYIVYHLLAGIAEAISETDDIWGEEWDQ